ncbi:efflux RND transporter permease subunit [Neosynechococcus sphagnicola]|uniref:efflux RND transporter permease subunit n=1 Tax=Neosynechococcus sphagnicola TaxID=1501145 RepID=UPI000907BDA0|nr:efflux RND transporter permease subunit [Neosynechococcus sphagnicola]
MVMLSIATNFIKRPVLATVCTLLILLAGSVCIPLLPISYLPPLTPVTVQVSATLTGGDALTVENTVTTPLERQINGATNMEYMTSSSTATGQSLITAYFSPNQDQSLAQVDVQNRVGIASPLLPTQVQQQGVSIQKTSPAILLAVGIYSPDDSLSPKFISNYVDLYINDEINRIPGIALVTYSGQLLYAMRIWLDPNALAGVELTAQDVITKVQQQNPLVGLGGLGQPPTPDSQTFLFTIPSNTQLTDVKDFENLVLKVKPNGDLVKLKDVGRAELGAQNYTSGAYINGHAGETMLIFQAATANALDVANAVKEKLAELQQNFPPGLVAEPVFDTTLFVNASTKDVLVTLAEAIGLVVLVIFVFLQDWRALVVPVIAIPVSLIGALAIAFVFGFSLNTLTMLGLVLATGLVVDDGIVVVEAIAEKVENGIPPRQAAIEAMNELTGAVISTSLVLMAVFVPVAFFPGTTGRIYQQFALTIAFSIAVSTFNALSFSPSIGGILLRRREHEMGGPLGWFFRGFNQGFDWFKDHYISLVEFLIRIRYLVLVFFGIGLAATFFLFKTLPGGFVPQEDQGVFLGIINAPPGVSLTYTNKVADQIWEKLKNYEEIEYVTVLPGNSNQGSIPNVGTMYASLKPWEERTKPDQQIDGLLRRVNQDFASITDARVVAVNLPAILGLGNYGGNEFQFQDRTGGKLTFDQFLENAASIIATANKEPIFNIRGRGTVFSPTPPSAPQIEIDIDRDRLEALNVNFNDAVTTLGTYLGSNFVSQFSYGPRYYQIYVQADAQFRDSPEDIGQIYVRSQDNQMVALSELVTIKRTSGPQVINHFNIYRSADIVSTPAPGFSSGQGIQAMLEANKEAAIPGTGYEWFGPAREELTAGGLGPIIFGLGLIVVFLVLSAQYESYVDPAIIMLTVPLAMLGALGFTMARGLVNNVYCQIALIMLIGLASKNAILIVELANQSLSRGMNYTQAVVHACRERVRPILMTALSGLAGFFPLLVASGAGANSRWSVGYAVFGGLFVATFLSLLLVPVLYVVIKNLAEQLFSGPPSQPPSLPPSPEAPPS